MKEIPVKWEIESQIFSDGFTVYSVTDGNIIFEARNKKSARIIQEAMQELDDAEYITEIY